MITIKQGEDLALDIPILDRNNSPLDLTLASAVRCALSVKNSVSARYADTVVAGYGILTFTGTSITLNITRTQSALFPIGTLTATVLIEFPDVVLTDKRYEYSTILGNVLKGELKDELI